MKKRRASEAQFQPRFRVLVGGEIALGPGKAQLLKHIAETGSIAEAAARMEMSYMRAWTLVKTMNACFREPLVTATRGGQQRGGAGLTDTGRTALALYRQMEAISMASMADPWKRLHELLKP